MPAKLYYSGFKIIPVFIEVGDYILTDGIFIFYIDIVVERKSIPTGDLFESIKIKGYKFLK